MNTKFQEVIDALYKKGYTDEQVAEFVTKVTEQAFANLYAKAITFFTEEDLKEIEALTKEEETLQKIKELFKLRSGVDADSEMQQFLTRFSEGFLSEFNKVPQSQPEITSSPQSS